MLNIIQNIPNVKTYPLTYVFEHMKLKHISYFIGTTTYEIGTKPNTLWLEFGVASGKQ
jgi:hypothetical protein